MKKVSFSSCPETKFSRLWHPGASRAQPWIYFVQPATASGKFFLNATMIIIIDL